MSQPPDTEDTGTYAHVIRGLRVASDMSIRSLATRAGIGHATLAAVENGKQAPTRRTLAALAVALDVPVAELIDMAPGAVISTRTRLRPQARCIPVNVSMPRQMRDDILDRCTASGITLSAAVQEALSAWLVDA